MLGFSQEVFTLGGVGGVLWGRFRGIFGKGTLTNLMVYPITQRVLAIGWVIGWVLAGIHSLGLGYWQGR